MFAAMLDGWRAQQLARNLAFVTIDKRLNVVRAFMAHADAYSWAWRAAAGHANVADLASFRPNRARLRPEP